MAHGQRGETNGPLQSRGQDRTNVERGEVVHIEQFVWAGLDQAASEAVTEARRACDKWPPFNSAHEGFAVLLEEVDEPRAHVWINQTKRDLDAMRREAIQVAAMAIRFVHD